MYDIEKERNERRTKQTDIENFLDDNKNGVPWFATCSGIFQGAVSSRDDKIITLRDAFYFTGNVRLSIGDVTIILNSIIAWGTSNPSLQNIFGSEISET